MLLFTNDDRLRALRSAYQDTPAVLLKVRTRSLVAEHGARVRLAGMNTGYNGRKLKERGAGTSCRSAGTTCVLRSRRSRS